MIVAHLDQPMGPLIGQNMLLWTVFPTFCIISLQIKIEKMPKRGKGGPVYHGINPLAIYTLQAGTQHLQIPRTLSREVTPPPPHLPTPTTRPPH